MIPWFYCVFDMVMVVWRRSLQLGLSSWAGVDGYVGLVSFVQIGLAFTC